MKITAAAWKTFDPTQVAELDHADRAKVKALGKILYETMPPEIVHAMALATIDCLEHWFHHHERNAEADQDLMATVLSFHIANEASWLCGTKGL